MQIEGMKIAVFDMDGTLLDSMPYWRKMTYDYVIRQGIRPTAEEEAYLRTLSGMLVANYLTEHYGIPTDYETLSRDSCAGMEPVYSAGVPLKPGARRYLEALGRQDVCRALATATPARLALLGLDGADLVRCLDRIWTTDALGGWKGEAEFFERLCRMAGCAPREMVLFEDSLYAIRTAAEVGVRCVGVRDATNVREREEMQRHCLCLIDSFEELMPPAAET